MAAMHVEILIGRMLVFINIIIVDYIELHRSMSVALGHL